MDAAARRALLRWYLRNRRDLPWRRSRDPYAIWVSEVMLQQTRVAAAAPYFERWMARFPTLAALAVAPEEEVMRVWSGLGYYSRARNLHKAAKAVCDAHNGEVPTTATALRQLPGVGAYTAGAIASIAFGERVAAVDGNVVRVATRILGIQTDPRAPATQRRIAEVAASWVPRDRAGDWNQAVMELGATICTPKAPRCEGCPVASACAARRLGLAYRIPMPKRRAAAQVEAMHFAAIVKEGKLLLARNPPGLMGGLWALPGGPVSTPLARLVAAQTGQRVRLARPASAMVHKFTHRTWRMTVRRGQALGAPGTAGQETTWLPLGQLGDAAVATVTRTALRSAGVGI